MAVEAPIVIVNELPPQRVPTEVYDVLVAAGLSPQKAYISALLIDMQNRIDDILAIEQKPQPDREDSSVSSDL